MIGYEPKEHLNDVIECENLGGARGVMVTVVGNGHGDTSSNPGPG